MLDFITRATPTAIQTATAMALAAQKSPGPKPAGTLYVAIYAQPNTMENHWALYLREAARNTIFQVCGDYPAALALAHLHNTRPSKAPRHIENIRVSHIYDAEAVERVHDLAYMQRRPDHEKGENCQDWVLAFMRALVAEGVVAAEDYNEVDDILLAKKWRSLAFEASGLGRKMRQFYTQLSELGPMGV
ncbi:MAG: hypothetical protein M1829_006282 [Trizodia sp. TS-e1964]|nr:MAG: hypothetical protein M1829_006282 [Trizodia sp. TS-e1964]